VLLSTAYGPHGHTSLRRGSLISAHRTNQDVAHVTLLNSMSTDTTYRGMLWLRFRNSWGAEWGDNGNASLDARHCLMNACEFLVIRAIKITELEQHELTTGDNGT
jgi:hypothetical protein